MRRRTLVFDLDGTLVDTAPDLTAALNAVLAGEGRPTVAPASVRAMVGGGARALLTRGFAATGTPLTPSGVEERVPAFLAHYREHLDEGSRPYPHVVAVLARLATAGCRLGVCTNKPIGLARELLDRLDLSRHFEAILGGDSRPYRKPDPRHVTDTVAALASTPGDAVMIGDSTADVAAAKSAGIPVVIAGYGYGAAEAIAMGGEAVIDSFGEIAAVLGRLP